MTTIIISCLVIEEMSLMRVEMSGIMEAMTEEEKRRVFVVVVAAASE